MDGEDSALGSESGFHSKLVSGSLFWSSRIGDWTIRVASNPLCQPSGSTMELSKLRSSPAMDLTLKNSPMELFKLEQEPALSSVLMMLLSPSQFIFSEA
ncbi:uncharacterized protein LOC110434431 [Sorghum bicolor]|uniref:uncharacterized protein LOC110434431 n=1 Tax=Sorghum bicolor TaxID=4558 RepID=UPI0007F19ABF|nr:uncharacterized protein LOC110434431 [Sorghum bicolor]|eukprot:XP_021314130.1 uncharacterized protein LOC110434431 [Sorghum bicolor]